jgi:ABC-type multidrug transport system fused ATPase/permease subunit
MAATRRPSSTDLAEQSLNALQDFTDFLHRWNFIPRSFDVREWADFRPLEAARVHPHRRLIDRASDHADGHLRAAAVAQGRAAAAVPGDLSPHAGPLRADRDDAVRGQSRADRAAGAGRARGARGWDSAGWWCTARPALDYSRAWFWVAVLLGLSAARAVVQYGAGLMSLSIGQELLTMLRERILIQVQRLDLGYHWRHGVGEMVTRMTRDADKVRDALINFWRQMFETGWWC